MLLRLVCSFYKLKYQRESYGMMNAIEQRSTHVSPIWEKGNQKIWEDISSGYDTQIQKIAQNNYFRTTRPIYHVPTGTI